MKKREGERIRCCKDPPPTCPRRYCAIAMRSLEQGMETEPKKKDGRAGSKSTDRRIPG